MSEKQEPEQTPEHPYTLAGVDLNAASAFSAHAGKVCRASFENNRFFQIRTSVHGQHRASRGWRIQNAPAGYFNVAGMDGNGTKPILNSAANTVSDAARDLVAMLAGDITRHGGYPGLMLEQVDIHKLGERGSETFQSMTGLIDALGDIAREQGLVLFGGEMAEMRDAVTRVVTIDGRPAFNWCGCMIGIGHDNMEITGAHVATGDAIIALGEPGFRANGISAVRRHLARRFGDEWWNHPDAGPVIREAARPSTLYDRFLTDMNGWNDPGFVPRIRFGFIAHNTGGGLPEKLVRPLFELGHSLVLDDLHMPSDLMQQVVAGEGMSDLQAYETLNGGQGAFIVVRKTDVREALGFARQAGLDPRVVGTIVVTPKSGPFAEVLSRYTDTRFRIEQAA